MPWSIRPFGIAALEEGQAGGGGFAELYDRNSVLDREHHTRFLESGPHDDAVPKGDARLAVTRLGSAYHVETQRAASTQIAS